MHNGRWGFETYRSESGQGWDVCLKGVVHHPAREVRDTILWLYLSIFKQVFICYNPYMATIGIEDLLKSKRHEILAIAKRHGVVSIRVFGSVARREETADSDIDFIVEVGSKHSPWFPAGLQRDLEALLGVRVDIVTPKALHWYIRDKTLAESKPL